MHRFDGHLRSAGDGRVGVLNQCYKGSIDNPDSASGTAWVVDPATNAKLKVQFFWPFSGDYWIIDLDPGYEYAVVGHPSREYLWILSRSPPGWRERPGSSAS